MAAAGLSFTLVDAESFESIPAPAQPGTRCQTCDYWERLDGHREASDSQGDADLKLSRLMAGAQLAGAYGMLAWSTDAAGDRVAVGWAQFGPISRYPRAQAIRERYPSLPDSPAPWVVTCLQVVPETADREGAAAALLAAVCDELDRRGIIAVEAYPEVVADPWVALAGARLRLRGSRLRAGRRRGALSRSTAASWRAPPRTWAGATSSLIPGRPTRARSGRCRFPRAPRRRISSASRPSPPAPTPSATTDRCSRPACGDLLGPRRW